MLALAGRRGCREAATGTASGALGTRVARAATPTVRTSTIAMAMKIRPSVMAAPVTWWVAHHWASCAGNQRVAPTENAARAATMSVHAIA